MKLFLKSDGESEFRRQNLGVRIQNEDGILTS
jgi:hypothetical protein